jgi:hypothetical protein
MWSMAYSLYDEEKHTNLKGELACLSLQQTPFLEFVKHHKW